MKRDIQYDIAKGIGMILVVLGHANAPFKSFIYLFHMALFFIISGYFYKGEKLQSLNSLLLYCKKQWTRLILPYIIFCTTTLILNNFFININLYTNNSDLSLIKENYDFNTALTYLDINTILYKMVFVLILSRGSELCPALWFLKVLFLITILYAILDYLLHRFITNEKFLNIIKINLIVCFAIGGVFLQKFHINFYNIGSIFSSIILFYLGTILKKYIKFSTLSLRKFIISVFFLIIASINNIMVDIAANKYPNLILFIFISLSGYFFIMYLSDLIKRNSILSKISIYIGMNTLPILFFHFLAFKLVNIVEIAIYGLPKFYLAAIPVIYSKPLWWLLYAFVGIIFPLIFQYLYQKLKLKFFNF